MSKELVFHYSELDPGTAAFVEGRTSEIRVLVRRSATDITEIGGKLIQVKERIGHGLFGVWLEQEFGWTDRTAQRFMNVAERFGKSDNLSDLTIAPSALYLLAAPSTPEAAVEEALSQAEGGAAVTYTRTREIVERHKESERFICGDCGEIFRTPVWHCAYCDHHWDTDRRDCPNCNNDRATPRDAANARSIQRDAPALFDAVKAGEMTIPQARRQIAAEARAVTRREVAGASDLTLYQADALEFIPALGGGSVALVIADPPYNVTDHAWDKIGTEREYLFWTATWLEALRPKLAAGYHLFLFCDPAYAARMEAVLEATRYELRSRMIWEYRNLVKGRDVRDRFITNWQMLFHCGAGPLNLPDEWDDRRFAVQNHARPQSNFDEGSHHPTPKPVSLLRTLVEFGSRPGDAVLDPFAGGGSTGQACVETGDRRCVLVEREATFCRAIEDRLGVTARGLR